MDYERLLEEIRARASLPDRQAAERAVAAILKTLGEGLLPLDASVIATELPEPLAEAILERPSPGALDLSELFDRVAKREGVSFGFAREHAIVVCQVLAETLPDEICFHVRERLPAALSTLFEAVPRPGRPPPAHTASHPRTTLSSGRPGSWRPVSEASSDRAQIESVARSENPHAATKLSSAKGISTERDHRTLAEGQDARERPIEDLE